MKRAMGVVPPSERANGQIKQRPRRKIKSSQRSIDNEKNEGGRGGRKARSGFKEHALGAKKNDTYRRVIDSSKGDCRMKEE